MTPQDPDCVHGVPETSCQGCRHERRRESLGAMALAVMAVALLLAVALAAVGVLLWR